jgi:glyceraldehyde 3-phosphate dehydrogenase
MIKLGINGFGRTGRTAARVALETNDIKLVAINSRSDPKSHAYLLKYDSVHGTFPHKVKSTKESIIVDDNKILCFQKELPSQIPWNKAKVDIVIEATGKFKDRSAAAKHIKGSVKKVIISAPSIDADIMVVLGVNHNNYKPKSHNIISNASCTTNCLAPICKVLMNSFGIEKGFMTTTHSVTGSQNILDNSHKKSKRRARAAFLSIIPTTTGASKALGFVLPKLKGKIESTSLRVPVHNVSIIDLTVILNKKVSSKKINDTFIQASKDELSSILSVADDELVSFDYIGSPYSAIVDPYLTSTNGRLAKIFAWYDNEMGYSSRLIDLAVYMGNSL